MGRLADAAERPHPEYGAAPPTAAGRGAHRPVRRRPGAAGVERRRRPASVVELRRRAASRIQGDWLGEVEAVFSSLKARDVFRAKLREPVVGDAAASDTRERRASSPDEAALAGGDGAEAKAPKAKERQVFSFEPGGVEDRKITLSSRAYPSCFHGLLADGASLSPTGLQRRRQRFHGDRDCPRPVGCATQDPVLRAPLSGPGPAPIKRRARAPMSKD